MTGYIMTGDVCITGDCCIPVVVLLVFAMTFANEAQSHTHLQLCAFLALSFINSLQAMSYFGNMIHSGVHELPSLVQPYS